MADRRCISKEIYTQRKFLELPPTSRDLYTYLVLYSDIDGITEAYSVMRMISATTADLKILDDCGYVKVLNEDYHEFRNTGTREGIEQEKQGIFSKLFSKKEKTEKFRLTKEQEKEMYDSLQQIHKQWQTRHNDGLDNRSWSEVRREYMNNCQKRAYEEQKAAKMLLKQEEVESNASNSQNMLKSGNTRSYADYEQKLDQLVIRSNHNLVTKKIENIQGNSLGIMAKKKENNDMTELTDKWGASLNKKSLEDQAAIIRQKRKEYGANPHGKGLVHSPGFDLGQKKKVKFKDDER